MASLNEVLTFIAAQLHADAGELIRYGNEDQLGGYHINEALRKWESGSIWGSEGQILYALVRTLKAERVVQIGGWMGCSAAHLAAAVRANGAGQVVSIDNNSEIPQQGTALTGELLDYVDFVTANGEDWLAEQDDNSLDLVFEDANHSVESVAALSRLSLQKLKPGGVLVNHDSGHDVAYVGDGGIIPSDLGRRVRDGLEQAGARYRPYITEESDCGLAISVKPGGGIVSWPGGFEPDKYSVKVDERPVVEFQGVDIHIEAGDTPMNIPAKLNELPVDAATLQDDFVEAVHDNVEKVIPKVTSTKRGRRPKVK